MIEYKWNKTGNFIEVKGYRRGLLNDKKFISEARITISQDGKVAKLIWIYISKSEQRKGYGTHILEEIKNNLLLILEFPDLLDVIIFDKVTSLDTLKLIKSIFPNAKLDFSHLPDFIREKRIQDFKDNPWIPKLSPAKYLNGNECIIQKNAPGVNFKLIIDRDLYVDKNN